MNQVSTRRRREERRREERGRNEERGVRKDSFPRGRREDGSDSRVKDENRRRDERPAHREAEK